MYQVLRNIFHFPGRYSGINAAGFNYGSFQHHGARCNDGVFVNDAAVHHNGTHPDQYIILYCTAMHHRVMADGHIAADYRGIFLVGTMNNGAILHIYFIAHFDRVYIAPDHGIEPDTAIITHGYITYNRGIGCYKTIFTELGVFAENREYQCHKGISLMQY